MSEKDTIGATVDEIFAKHEEAAREQPEEIEAEDAELVEDEQPDDEADDAEEMDLADDDDEEPDDEEEPEEPTELDLDTLVTTKVAGQESKQKLRDVLNEFNGVGYAKQVIDQNKNMQRELVAAVQAQQARAQEIEQLYMQAQTGSFLPQPQRPEYNPNDPIGTMEARDRYERDLEAWQAQQGEIQRLQQERSAITQRAEAERLKQERQKLAEYIPDFADEAKAKEVQSAMTEYAQSQGFAPEELANVTDSRTVKILHKAMLYDRQMAQGKAKAAEPPKAKSVKPGARRKDSSRKQHERNVAKAMASGSTTDVVDALFAKHGLE